MATITLYARVRKENANNEFAFLDRDNKSFNLKKIFPSDSKKSRWFLVICQLKQKEGEQRISFI